MKAIYAIILFSIISSSLIAQNINLVIIRDTIDINVEGHLEQSQVVDDKYYSFFRKEAPYGGSSRKMYIISRDGTIEHIVDNLPKDFHNYYSDFHIRNDSILTKMYYKDETYYFNKDKFEWTKLVISKDDLIYEDEDYYVTSLDFGEWGGTIWFKDKKTNIEYRIADVTPYVHKFEGSYFLTTSDNILRIDNPKQMEKCLPEKEYKYVLKHGGDHSEMYFNKGFENYYKAQKPSYLQLEINPCFTRVITSFTVHNRFMHLLNDNCKVYITEVQNGNMVTHNLLGEDIRIHGSAHAYRNPIHKNNNQVFKFSESKGDLSGIMEMKSDTIAMHYFDNKYRHKYNHRGKQQMDRIFAEYLASACSNYEGKNIDEIKANQAITNNLLDITGHDDDAERYTRMIFRANEDSLFVHTITYNYSFDERIPLRSIYTWKDDTSFRNKNKQDAADKYEIRFSEIKSYIQKYLKDNNMFKFEKKDDKYSIKWETKQGLTLNLYSHGLKKDFREHREIRLFIGY